MGHVHIEIADPDGNIAVTDDIPVTPLVRTRRNRHAPRFRSEIYDLLPLAAATKEQAAHSTKTPDWIVRLRYDGA
jgi:hypothetical protein